MHVVVGVLLILGFAYFVMSTWPPAEQAERSEAAAQRQAAEEPTNPNWGDVGESFAELAEEELKLKALRLPAAAPQEVDDMMENDGAIAPVPR